VSDSSVLDLGRWRETPASLGARRWVIVSTGLRQVLRMRFFRILVMLGWITGLLMAAIGILFTQSIATGGWLESWAANFGPRAEAIASGVCAMILLYPDIVVRGLYTALFWAHSEIGLGLSLVAMTVLVPRLIARDRASHALTIYLSRPLRSSDYLLGKLGIVVCLTALLWTGPLLGSWALGMLAAPGSEFFVHSVGPLGRAMLHNLVSLIVVSTIAFGVSAAARSARGAVLLWLGVWLLAGMIAQTPGLPEPLRWLAFTHGLDVVREHVLALSSVLGEAAEVLPFVGEEARRNLSIAAEHLAGIGIGGPAGGLAFLVALSSAVFLRRIRPE
jgi:hypothetical protein